MKVLLTGANGLLGQKLVEMFTQNGNNTLLATGRGRKRFSLTADYVEMDICDKERVKSVFEDFKPEAVVNTAAMTNVDECEQDPAACDKMNIESVEILVQSCAIHNTFLLQLSTDFIFDGSHGPLTEEENAGPVNHYGATKLEAERIIIKSSIPWAIARTVLVYGLVEDMSRSNIILWVRENLRNGKKIRVVDDQWRTPTLAEDLAKGCFLIIDQKAQGVFNISGKDMLTPYQMAVKTADHFRLDTSLIEKVDSKTFTQPAKRPGKTGFVIEKARKILGYSPHSFEEGIGIIASQLENFNK